MNETQTPPPASEPYLDQYKAYIEDLGNIGTRYATSNGFYLSVVTALLGILALTKAGEAFVGAQAYLAIAVPVFAILVCWIWWQTVAFYGNLFHAKFEVLREIEKKGELFHIYEREYEELKKRNPPHSLLENERLVPLALIFVFSLILLYVLGTHVYMLCKLHP